MAVGPAESSCVWNWRTFIYIRVVHYLKSELRSLFLFSVVERVWELDYRGQSHLGEMLLQSESRCKMQIIINCSQACCRTESPSSQKCKYNEMKLQQYPQLQRANNCLLKTDYAAEPCIHEGNRGKLSLQ